MIRLAHLSDTHFGTEISAIIKALEDALKTLRPDLLILSGDITQRARKKQFLKAKAFLDETKIPFLSVPGNHDLPLFDVITRFTRPYRHYLNIFGEREFIKITNKTAIIGLDATGPERHKQGALDLSHVRQIFEGVRSRIGNDGQMIVVVHQPLMTAWREDRSEEMNNEAAVAQLFSAFRIDAVLSGHVHVPLICTSEKAYPHLPYSFVHSGAGTATSRRTRENKPNSFNFLEIGSTDMKITQYDYDAGSTSFISLPTQHFLREPQGWKLR